MERNKEQIKKFWDDIIRNPDGTINEEQLYKELSDFSFVMNHSSIVYDNITGGTFTKCTWSASTITEAAAENYKKIYLEQAEDFVNALIKHGIILEDKKDEAKKQIEYYF